MPGPADPQARRARSRHPLRGVALALAGLLALGAAQPALAGPRTVLVFDASNSMNSVVGSSTRVELLKGAVRQVAPTAAGQLDLGLIAFGNREQRSCTDIQTLVEAGPDGAQTVAAAVAGITAQGVSAVAPALQVAAQNLDYRNKPGAIVLVADSSGVDNCRVDTCATARTLAGDAAGLKIHVIAFAARPEEVPKLQCIATETGGVFHVANSGAELTAALSAAFAAAATTPEPKPDLVPPPRPKPHHSATPQVAAATPPAEEQSEPEPAAPDEQEAATGPVVPPPRPKPDFAEAGGGGGTNESVFAPTTRVTGETETAAAAAPAAESNESVMAPSSGSTAEAESGESVMAPGAPGEAAGEEVKTANAEAQEPGETVLAPPEQAAVTVRAEPEEPAGPPISTTRPGPPRTTILVKARAAPEPAMTAAVDASQAVAPPSAAGPPGHIKLAAYVVADTRPIPSGMLWQVMEARPGGAMGDLVARSAEATPDLELPAGDYVVRAVFGNASRTSPVTVKADTETGLDIVLNAGGLQIIALVAGQEVADGEVHNTIYRVGDDQPVARDTPSGRVIYLTAGTYRVESRYGSANAVTTVEIAVQPGKLVKGKIDHRAGQAAFRLVPEGGGAPLADTVWQVLAPGGRVVTESTDPTPTYVFAEGAYDLIVQHGGKTYRSSFDVKPGQPTDVEVVAR